MQSSDSKSDFIYLDSLDGSEFESLCAMIFEKLGYGRVENIRDVADEGRDLIIHTVDGGKIIVECKHHPRGTIGRPVVQKLHSAVVTEAAAKGILITTGKFSEEAIEHARKIMPPVELIDSGLLFDLSERAGIRLGTQGQAMPIGYFPVSNENAVATTFLSSLGRRFLVSPPPSTIPFEVSSAQLTLRPVFLIKYDLHQDFETSVGVIHSVHVRDGAVLLDGSSGEGIPTRLAEFYKGVPVVSSENLQLPVEPISRENFQIDKTTLLGKARQVVGDLHTKRVSYYGRNNVRYTTTCRPSDRSIFIKDTKQVLVPQWSLSFIALSKSYSVRLLEKPGAVDPLETDLSKCRICGQRIDEEILFCTTCGNLAHKGHSDGYACKVCGRTICRYCTQWTRKWLILKQYMCEGCADHKVRVERKRVRRLAEDLRLKHCMACGIKIHLDAVRCTKCGNMQL